MYQLVKKVILSVDMLMLSSSIRLHALHDLEEACPCAGIALIKSERCTLSPVRLKQTEHPSCMSRCGTCIIFEQYLLREWCHGSQ